MLSYLSLSAPQRSRNEHTDTPFRNGYVRVSPPPQRALSPSPSPEPANDPERPLSEAEMLNLQDLFEVDPSCEQPALDFGQYNVPVLERDPVLAEPCTDPATQEFRSTADRLAV